MPLVRIIDEINMRYPLFSRSERKVADYVKEHFTQISRMSIHQLKKEIGVSEPTVFRFCQALGYSGYSEFKISLAEQNPTFKDYFTVSPTEGKGEVQILVERMLLEERQTIDATLHIMNYQQLEKAAQAIVSARRILFFGVSTSYSVAQDIQRYLVRLGLSAWALNEFHEAVSLLTSFDTNDLLVCVTQTGETRETIETARKAKAAHVPVLCVTAFTVSTAAQASDIIIQTCAPERSENRVGLTTRTAQSAVMNALFMTIGHLLGSRAVTMLETANANANTQQTRRISE